MTQVPKAEPDASSSNNFRGNETWQIPAIGTPEHAALVEAIKQNFPEIYVTPNDSSMGKQLRDHSPELLQIPLRPGHEFS